MTSLVHIVAGGLGLLSGYVALYATKGAALHRRSGMLFVDVMTTMAITGMLISAVEGVAPAIFYWLWRIRVRRSVRAMVRIGAPETA